MKLSSVLPIAANLIFSRLALASPTPSPPCNVSTLLDPNQNRLGAVASESSECTQIGIDILAEGGNAADAIVGTVFCVGVIGMYHSGIGGGGFMLVRNQTGGYEFIDFRESMPAAGNETMYSKNISLSLYGGMASGVPGELRGLEHLHTKYGRLPWSTLIQPAINLARNGFVVSQDLVNYMRSAITGNPSGNFLVNDISWAIDFAPNGTQVGLGDIMTRKRYADTLEAIANYGPNVFYQGAIANATIRAIQNTGGIMTHEDLTNYTILSRKPSQITYRGFKITSGSAPSGGEVALAVMKAIEGYTDIGNASTLNISTHRIDEATRFAYGMRANLGDPLYLQGLQTYEDQMVSEAVAAEVRAKITDVTHNISYYDPTGLESLETPGTSQIVAADITGMAISLTTTVNLLFGSQVMVPETGVILNDEMNDFSVPGVSNAFGYAPSPANYIRPGKRPLSSISTTLVEHLSNSTFYFAIGAAGGSRIITSTIQNLWHVLDQGMTTAQALAQPRFHDQLIPNVISFETTYNNATVADMKARGHNVTWVAPGQSTAQGLRMLPNGTFEAAGEPRQLNSKGAVI